MNYLIVSFIIAGVCTFNIVQKKRLSTKFKKEEHISGKNKEEAISMLGKPNSESILADGTYLLQWHKDGDHIGIVFDNAGNFVRVASQKMKL